jgi:ACS family hexuronate transporter-like MFS transporter
MAHALVQGLASLASVRALLGFGEAAFYPAAMAGMSKWFPPRDRAKAVGLLLSALSIGTLLAVPAVAFITAEYGWRASFLATGAAGFLLLPFWRMVHRPVSNFRRNTCAAAGEDVELASTPLLSVLQTRKYCCILAARGCASRSG